MKLTKREKLMLQVFCMVAIVALSYYFIIIPQIDNLKVVSEQLIAKDLEVSMVKTEIASIPSLEEEVSTFDMQIQDSTEQFFPELLQKKLIVILDKVFNDSGISAESISFSQINVPTIEGVLPDTATTPDAAATPDTTTPSDVISQKQRIPIVESMSITIPLKGSYEQIMESITKLEEMNRVIIINSIQLATAEDGLVSGGINIDFYALSKDTLNSQDEEYTSWPYDNPHGIFNPFKGTTTVPPVIPPETPADIVTPIP